MRSCVWVSQYVVSRVNCADSFFSYAEKYNCLIHMSHDHLFQNSGNLPVPTKALQGHQRKVVSGSILRVVITKSYSQMGIDIVRHLCGRPQYGPIVHFSKRPNDN